MVTIPGTRHPTCSTYTFQTPDILHETLYRSTSEPEIGDQATGILGAHKIGDDPYETFVSYLQSFVLKAFENRASTASTTTTAAAAESLPPSQPSSAEPLDTPVEDGGTRNNPRGSQSNRGSRPVTTSRVGESRRGSRSGATSRAGESRQESRAASSQEGIGGTAVFIAPSEADDFSPSEPPPIHEAGTISPIAGQAVITEALNLEMTSSLNLHNDVETAYALLPLPAVPVPDPKILAIPDEKVRQLVRRPVVRRGERPPLRRIEILPWPVVPSRAQSRGSHAPQGSAGAGAGGATGVDGRVRDTEKKANIDTIKAHSGELGATGTSSGVILTAGVEHTVEMRAASGALGEDGYRWVVSETSERQLDGVLNTVDTPLPDTSTRLYALARPSGEASGDLTREFETPKRELCEGLRRSGIYTCENSMSRIGEALVSHRNLTFAASYAESQSAKTTVPRTALYIF